MDKVFLLVAIAASFKYNYALQCGMCESLESHDNCKMHAEYSKCTSIYDRCASMSFNFSGQMVYAKACIRQDQCASEYACPAFSMSCEVECCSEDYCNRATAGISDGLWLRILFIMVAISVLLWGN